MYLQMKRLLERVYYLNDSQRKYVSLFLDENLTPHARIVCGNRAVVLNQIQWFILVTFKDNIPKNVIHELGDSLHTLDLYCGKYARITCDNVHVVLTKSQWNYLMHLAEFCLSRQITKLFYLRDDLEKWRKECLETKSFATPPKTMVVDLEALYDEIMYKTNNEKDCIYYVK